MSSSLTETPGTWPSAVTAPDGTDVVSITALRTAMQYINNRILRTRQSLGMAVVAGVGTSTTRIIPMRGLWYATNWNPLYFGGIATYLQQNTLSASYEIAIPIGPELVPNGSTITAVSAWIDPPAGHTGTNPSTMPAIKLDKLAAASSIAPSTIGTAVDATGSGSYESAHSITLSGLTEVVDHATYAYYLMARGEYGGTAQTGLLWQAATVVYTPPV